MEGPRIGEPGGTSNPEELLDVRNRTSADSQNGSEPRFSEQPHIELISESAPPVDCIDDVVPRCVPPQSVAIVGAVLEGSSNNPKFDALVGDPVSTPGAVDTPRSEHARGVDTPRSERVWSKPGPGFSPRCSPCDPSRSLVAVAPALRSILQEPPDRVEQPPADGRTASAPLVTSMDLHDLERGEEASEDELPPQPATIGRARTVSASWATTLGQNLSGALLRNVSGSVSNARLIPTTLCHICLENCPTIGSIVLSECGREEHSVCRDCFKTYVKGRIDEGRVQDLWCPCRGDDGCIAKATEEELATVLEESMMEKYRRFVRMRENPHLRQCPRCNELCRPDECVHPDGSKSIIPEVTCESCGFSFCYYHSNAHAVGSKACAEYERKMVSKEKKELAKIGTRVCPRCGVITEKMAGCNHINCNCGCEWCWVCGQEISNVGWHYNPLRPFSCAQFAERVPQQDHMRLALLSSCLKLISWPGSLVSIAFMLVFGVVFLAIILISFALLNFVIPCMCLTKKKGHRLCERIAVVWSVLLTVGAIVDATVVGVPFCLFCLVWALIMLVPWALLVPLGANSDQWLVMAMVPASTLFATFEIFMGGNP